MKPNLKHIAVLICGIYGSLTAQATEISSSDTLSTAPAAGATATQVSLETIEQLALSHENDPGAEHIKQLLVTRFSPLRGQLENHGSKQVQSFIDKFSANNYRFHLGKMLGLSHYYFPIFEHSFLKAGVPLEIKYLAIVESSLNPNAVSRMGATGPWQFMYATAKEHGLIIDKEVDERKDPAAASFAAANYLKEAFDYYQDWLLAIASYNCGRGNVNRAIERSGQEKPTFWSIQHLLPSETQNYVPAFIAMYHVLEKHQQYGIVADATGMPEETETIMVDRKVSLPDVAQALGLNTTELQAINPAYKKMVINGSPHRLQRLIVPAVEKHAYQALYLALQGEKVQPAMQASMRLADAQPAFKHAVKRGETLEKIAKRYGVSVQDLKAWNKLKNHIIQPGKQLSVHADQSRLAENSEAKDKVITYRVKKGDTLSGIAQRHKGTSVNQLKAMNQLKSSRLQPGMTLKVTQL